MMADSAILDRTRLYTGRVIDSALARHDAKLHARPMSQLSRVSPREAAEARATAQATFARKIFEQTLSPRATFDRGSYAAVPSSLSAYPAYCTPNGPAQAKGADASKHNPQLGGYTFTPSHRPQTVDTHALSFHSAVSPRPTSRMWSASYELDPATRSASRSGARPWL
jgi:hypothetical protein